VCKRSNRVTSRVREDGDSRLQTFPNNETNNKYRNHPGIKKNPTSAEWKDTESEAKMQYIADVAFTKQHVEDNPEARRKGEEERLLTHLYQYHCERIKQKATPKKA